MNQTTLDLKVNGVKNGRGSSETVLILTPLEHDAEVLQHILSNNHILSRLCAGANALQEALDEGAGVVLLTEEALTEQTLTVLKKSIQGQPPWSDLPLILLAASDRHEKELTQIRERLGPDHNATILTRPASKQTLLTVINAALRARHRQYEIRDINQSLKMQVAKQKQTETQLKQLTETLEEKVDERTKQVRALAAALNLAEQRERQRISRILHDHLQQILVAAQLNLHMIESNPPHQLPATVVQLNEMLDEALNMTRTLTVELSPPVIEGEELDKILRWLATKMKEAHGLKVNVESKSEYCVADKDMRILLYQLVRELLFNVVKHAGVDHATVKLFEEDNFYMIQVQDQGSGFDVIAMQNQQRREGGVGLRSVQRRVQLVGGRLKIESQPGKGTSITIAAPASGEIIYSP